MAWTFASMALTNRDRVERIARNAPAVVADGARPARFRSLDDVLVRNELPAPRATDVRYREIRPSVARSGSADDPETALELLAPRTTHAKAHAALELHLIVATSAAVKRVD